MRRRCGDEELCCSRRTACLTGIGVVVPQWWQRLRVWQRQLVLEADNVSAYRRTISIDGGLVRCLQLCRYAFMSLQASWALVIVNGMAAQ